MTRFVAALGVLWLTATAAAAPRVELEVCTEQGFSITGGRDWTQMLGEVGFDSVRIRGAKGADAPAVQTQGTESSRVFRVVGILTSGGKLRLTGGTFGLGDRDKLAAWLAKLKEGGDEALTTKPAAFGLLPKQLVSVHEALAVPVVVSTKGKRPRDVAKQIAYGLSLKFIADAGPTRGLAADEPIADELQGLSSGTTLAAILRPLGLVMYPEKNGGEIRLRIADSRDAAEQWPIGWPPPGNPRETAPELFKFLNVEIAEGTPLAESLAAIGQRVKVPMVIDYNALARLDIDLAEKKVGIPKTNTFYAKILDRLLFPAMLRYEVRVDEAGKPLLWVSSLQQ
jgi:hypothetical protein